MIDIHTTRIAGLANTIPAPVMWIQLGTSALALGALGMHLAMLVAAPCSRWSRRGRLRPCS